MNNCISVCLLMEELVTQGIDRNSKYFAVKIDTFFNILINNMKTKYGKYENT